LTGSQAAYTVIAMAFEIVLTFEANDDLRRLKPSARATVRAALKVHLRHEPTKLSRSRIKKLRDLKVRSIDFALAPSEYSTMSLRM
jgi:hypothetical protein